MEYESPDAALNAVINMPLSPEDTGDLVEWYRGFLRNIFDEGLYDDDQIDEIKTTFPAVAERLRVVESAITLDAIQRTCTLDQIAEGSLQTALDLVIPCIYDLRSRFCRLLLLSAVKKFLIENPETIEMLQREVEENVLPECPTVSSAAPGIPAVIERLFVGLCRKGMHIRLGRRLFPQLGQ